MVVYLWIWRGGGGRMGGGLMGGWGWWVNLNFCAFFGIL